MSDLYDHPSRPAWPACGECSARTGQRHRPDCRYASMWAYFDSRRDQHEPSEQCEGMHCYSHYVDEPGEGYRGCGECFHLYKTPQALRRAYRHAAARLFWDDLRGKGPKLPDDPIFIDLIEADGMKVPKHPRWQALWQLISLAWNVRADKIYFCQECLHDF